MQPANEREDQVEDDDVSYLRPGEEQEAGGHRSARHYRPAMSPVDRRSHRIGREPGHGEAERGCAVELRLRPAEIGAHCLGNQREAVEERTPGTDLRDSQRGDHALLDASVLGGVEGPCRHRAISVYPGI
jgi:hypothetical protein